MPVLVRYDEIGIKGKNRARFENALVKNIEAKLRANNVKFSKAKRTFGRILIDTDDNCDCLKTVFGISSFSHAFDAGKTIEETFSAVKQHFKLSEKDSFKINCQRLDKDFPMDSRMVCVRLGEMLRTATNAKVKMENPLLEINLEIIRGRIYILSNRIKGPGGMPVGCQGTAIALIENKASVVAAVMVMKRGCKIIPVMLNNVDISLLQKFSFEKLAPLKINFLSELEDVCKRHNVDAVVINDTFGKTREIAGGVIVLRPLSGMDESEIENERKKLAG
ncbi:MAG: THUMP domain-containing protein [Candidatus Woesearchaeota archaeon]